MVRGVRSRSLVPLLLVFALLSCSKDESGSLRQRRPLRIVLSSPVTSLDPQAIHADSSRSIVSNIFEGLVAFDFEAKILPALAVSWSNPS